MKLSAAFRSFGALFLLLALILIAGVYAGTAAESAPSAGGIASAVDPNKASSEFNHHLAGYALVGVGLLVLLSYRSPRFHWLQFVWPWLFVFAGLFLAVWSDAEMWPRGNLSWGWLLQHDQEARQHKIYALLLIAIGVLEYLRARGGLNAFLRRWSFPILAVLGAGLLLIHDHSGSSGARSAEARAYLVNPALDPDGKPWAADPLSASPRVDPPATGMDHAAMNHDSMHMKGAGDAMQAPSPSPDLGHSHHMTPVMQLVQREHFWFMLVGLAIAAFKLASDANLVRRTSALCLWPGATILLGILLTLYHE